jgi:hypothetical protein
VFERLCAVVDAEHEVGVHVDEAGHGVSVPSPVPFL